MGMHTAVSDDFEIIRRIRSSEKGSDISIIAATASAFEEDRQKILEQGVNGYLIQPIQEQALFNLIAECLDIEYTYEPVQKSVLPAQPRPAMTNPRADGALSIPVEMTTRLQAAALAADLDQVLEIIDQLDLSWPQTAAQLRQLANRLQYDELLNYLRKVLNVT
jgi:CheY-like chemotaxis protein